MRKCKKMRNRLFILTNDPVPYGTANSNYVRNFAKSVANEGWDVVVIGMKRDEEHSQFYQITDHNDNIQYWNFNTKRLGKKNYLETYFRYDKEYLSVMEMFGINERDYIYVYSTELATARAAINASIVPATHKSYGEVEWFQPYQYKYGKFNTLYILWKIGFHYRASKFEKAIPISRNLEKYCKKNRCRTLIVPAMVDTTNEALSTENIVDSLVHFIYPGAASDKDSFPCMIKALTKLEKRKKEKVRFHLTGSMSKGRLLQILRDAKQLEMLENVLVFHGWMEYDELINLYRQSDYLLLARAKNTVTLSNFPSKVPEMMNYGIVPVCSNVGDYTEMYLQDGIDSIQFQEDSVDSCTEAICKAIEIKGSPQYFMMKKKARQTAINKFDYRNWGKRIVEFLQN